MAIKVDVKQKKYFFDSITDWVRWNYQDGKVSYKEGVNAFTLEELGAITEASSIDGMSLTSLKGFTNQDLFKKCKVIIFRNEDLLEGTVGVNWEVKTEDDKARFICSRIELDTNVKFVSSMTNYSHPIDYGTRVPLIFDESKNGYPCFGKSFLRVNTPDNLVLPNIDTKHITNITTNDDNLYRGNSAIASQTIEVDGNRQRWFCIGDVGYECYKEINNLHMRNLKENYTCPKAMTLENVKWIIYNGLLKVDTTRVFNTNGKASDLSSEDIAYCNRMGWTLS